MVAALRVLLIDDEPDVLLLCRVNLEFAGHEVLEAEDGEHGYDVANERHPDVIVLDVMLPNKDGFQILEELHQNPTTSQTPVVLLTAKTQSTDRLRGYRAGADEYVTKPFSPTTLCKTVETVAHMSPKERMRRREAEVAALAEFE